MNASAPTNIILVHGTFASDAEWIQPHSVLCTSLRERFPRVEFFPFTWSGQNSHSARIIAGEQLGQFLSQLKAKSLDRPCYVIAHSHGGNVVLYALSQPSAEPCVDGCVFLGTPFINTRRRDLTLFVPTIAFQITWLIAYMPLTVLLILGLGAFNGLLASTGVLFFAIPFANAPIIERAVTNRIRDALSARLSTIQKHFCQYVTPAALSRPSLSFYVRGDEAKAWLGVVNSLSESPFVANEYMLAFLRTWPLLFVLGAVATIIDWLVGERSAFAVRALVPSLLILLSGLFVVVVMALVMPVASVVSRAHRAGFGWEGLFGYSLVDLFITVYPPCAKGAVATAVESQPQYKLGKGLRHSGLYLDTKVIKTIADWFEQPRSAVARSDPTLPTTPLPPELRRPDPDTVLDRCILASLTILLLGASWSLWEMFHHFRDIPNELTSGNVVRREVLVPRQTYMLGPKEEGILPILLRRPPPGQTSYIAIHYKSNSVEGHVFLGLPEGPAEWESVSGVCPWRVRRAYSEGLGPRELSFARKLDFANDSAMRGCVEIKNYGKKSRAAFDVEIWLEFIAN